MSVSFPNAPTAGQTFIDSNGTSWQFIGERWVATVITNRFISLADTPVNYAGAAGFKVVVNGTEDGVEFVADGGGGGSAENFLAPSASNPATRDDASALQEGDVYYNTTDNELKAYDGATWNPATLVYVPPGDGAFLAAATGNPATRDDGSALQEGDTYYNSTANELRAYNGATWDVVGPVYTPPGDGAYLAASTTDPTTRDDGNALQEGDFYWKSDEDKFRVYDGSAFADYSAGGGGGGSLPQQTVLALRDTAGWVVNTQFIEIELPTDRDFFEIHINGVWWTGLLSTDGLNFRVSDDNKSTWEAGASYYDYKRHELQRAGTIGANRTTGNSQAFVGELEDVANTANDALHGVLFCKRVGNDLFVHGFFAQGDDPLSHFSWKTPGAAAPATHMQFWAGSAGTPAGVNFQSKATMGDDAIEVYTKEVVGGGGSALPTTPSDGDVAVYEVGAAQYPSSRYWRLLITASNGARADAQEVEFRETYGGADAVPTQSNDANVIYSERFSASFTGYFAFDNSTGTYWSTLDFNTPGGEYIGFIFPTTKFIREFYISGNSFIPVDMELQYSTGDENGPWVSTFGVVGNGSAAVTINDSGFAYPTADAWVAKPKASEVVDFTGTALTLDDTYNGQYIRCTNVNPVTITTAAGLADNFEVTLEQWGTGAVSVAAGASTTLNSRDAAVAAAGRYSVFGLKHVGSNIFTLFGDIA